MKAALYTDESGFVWRPYCFNYRSDDKIFGLVLYALSMEHASYVIEDLKATAVLDGELMHVIPMNKGNP